MQHLTSECRNIRRNTIDCIVLYLVHRCVLCEQRCDSWDARKDPWNRVSLAWRSSFRFECKQNIISKEICILNWIVLISHDEEAIKKYSVWLVDLATAATASSSPSAAALPITRYHCSLFSAFVKHWHWHRITFFLNKSWLTCAHSCTHQPLPGPGVHLTFMIHSIRIFVMRLTPPLMAFSTHRTRAKHFSGPCDRLALWLHVETHTEKKEETTTR